MKDVFITSAGIFLPNKPIGNEEMENYLGRIHGKGSLARERILKQNGIRQRHFALDTQQKSTHSNAQMAALAIRQSLERSSLAPSDIDLLCTATSQGDLPLPGFASMVHSQLDIDTCELASFQSICASSMMAIKHAFAQIKSGEARHAACVGSEFASRMFKASRFEAQQIDSPSFDVEFLRWMLSDGAGALVLQDQVATNGLSLKIDWIDIKSHAHRYPLCMYTGKTDNKNESELTWLDYPDYESASQAGAINLRQDIRLLDQVVKQGVAHYFELIDQGKINASHTDWLCCHYSSEYFKAPIQELMEKGGGSISQEKWFSNLTTKGNTGAASIFVMLEELLYSGKLEEGNTILCMVPESGRFITSFMQLSVQGSPKQSTTSFTIREVEAPELVLESSPISEWLIRQLAQIWIDFETRLLKLPIISRIHEAQLSLDDYKLLLHDLRQQVIDGSQWISRAASHIDIELFELRSAFIRHAATEHKDYQLLEKNYAALGEDIENIQTGRKNIGGNALSAYMFHQASQANPVDLLGAMFIIEGIGKRLAGYWGRMIQDQLNLTEDQVSFFTYHGVADENHFHRLEQALNHPKMNMDIAHKIVKTAKTTARLYEMQLAELGNY